MVNVKNFYSETDCEQVFKQLGKVYNANTPENHPVIFKSDDDYRAAISILAVCICMYSGIKLYAYQFMSNHIHLVIGGDEELIQEFFRYFASRLKKHLGGQVDLREFKLKLFEINDLNYMRNAIVYTNRNGFVVNNNVTPFSYPWGCGSYFFQPIAISYAKLTSKPIGVIQIRSLMHSRKSDEFKDLKLVDNSICPLEFCEIGVAERLFRDAKQYFYMISRNVESYAEVAKSIGEAVYFNDSDIYLVAVKLANQDYDTSDLRTLTANAKIDLAKRLHYDYNAGNKQIQRILKIDSEVLRSLF